MPEKNKQGRIITGQGGRPLGSTTRRGGATKTTTKKTQNRTPDSSEKTKTWWDKNKKTVIDSLEAGSKVADHMADKHQAANAGLSSAAAYGNFGEGQTYDTRPNTVTRKLNKETDEWEY